MLLTQYIAPAIEPVTLAEVLAQLRLDIVAPTLSSGNLVVGQWYEILSTTADYFYAGCQVGDTFQAAAATALDANDTVQQITEGAYLNSLIRAARAYVEKLCGPLITQTWNQFEHHFPCEFYWWQFGSSFWRGYPMLVSLQPERKRYRHGFTIELPNIQSIISVTYTDVTNTAYTLDPTTYTLVLDDFRSHIVLVKGQQWPEVDLLRGNAIQIEFVCGFGPATTDIPEPVRQAIMMHVANRYENRIPDPKVEEYVEKAIENLVANYRWEGF